MAENLEVVKREEPKRQTATAQMATAQEKENNLPILEPSNRWPPPLYVRAEADSREVYYMQHRWYSQWKWYDDKAATAKQVYQRIQLTITVGSAVVPVLVGIQAIDARVDLALYVVTIVVSLSVAAASAIETVKKYGDAWRSYRTATEELQREKSMYDMMAGPYRRSTNPFLLFVERCEDIMAKQNGNFAPLKEEDSRTRSEFEDGEEVPAVLG